jgi:lantibiotic modifying enzyme
MTLRRQVQRSKSTIERIGAYAGWGGIIYTLAHLGSLWNEPELFVEAEGLIEQLLPLIEQDETFDIINGCAGALASLIVLQRCQPTKRTLDAALKCGDRLIDSAQKMERGIGWETKVSAKSCQADSRTARRASHGH